MIVFERRASAGRPGGIDHFAFRLKEPGGIDDAIRQAEAAGATILRHGDFGPGLPYLHLADPDGYTVEIWSE